MAQPKMMILSDVELFKLCAAAPDQDEYWEEFIKRYNRILVSSVYYAYQRFARVRRPPEWAVAELLQDTYVQILKGDCLALRCFRGRTDKEAIVYLAQIAINLTIRHLRQARALKRQAGGGISGILMQNGTACGPVGVVSDYTDGLAERELVEALRRICTGPNKRRNILLFLLHVREGLTAGELAASGICDLAPSSIANLLNRIKAKLKKVFWQ